MQRTVQWNPLMMWLCHSTDPETYMRLTGLGTFSCPQVFVAYLWRWGLLASGVTAVRPTLQAEEREGPTVKLL
jgi:hypothetical protein